MINNIVIWEQIVEHLLVGHSLMELTLTYSQIFLRIFWSLIYSFQFASFLFFFFVFFLAFCGIFRHISIAAHNFSSMFWHLAFLLFVSRCYFGCVSLLLLLLLFFAFLIEIDFMTFFISVKLNDEWKFVAIFYDLICTKCACLYIFRWAFLGFTAGVGAILNR